MNCAKKGSSFNEAAAIAAEIPCGTSAGSTTMRCFNEAAAIAAEILIFFYPAVRMLQSFNEAAAIAAEIRSMSEACRKTS